MFFKVKTNNLNKKYNTDHFCQNFPHVIIIYFSIQIIMLILVVTYNQYFGHFILEFGAKPFSIQGGCRVNDSVSPRSTTLIWGPHL